MDIEKMQKESQELLKQIDEKVFACELCGEFVEKFPNARTVFLGKDNDIVLVGEAPANNGWRKVINCGKMYMVRCYLVELFCKGFLIL